MKTTVNERVKTLREHLGLSQNDFANGIETSITSISRIENGFATPRASTLHRIIKVYGADKDWLINGSGELRIVSTKVNEAQILWKDEAFIALKDEVGFLKKQAEWMQNLISNLSQKAGNPNFLKATELLRVA